MAAAAEQKLFGQITLSRWFYSIWQFGFGQNHLDELFVKRGAVADVNCDEWLRNYTGGGGGLSGFECSAQNIILRKRQV